MNKMIFCLVVLFLCGCQITSTPSIVYDCAEADKPAISDFVLKCAGQLVPVIDTSESYNIRLNTCSKKAQELFCRPTSPKPDNPSSAQ